MIRKYVIKKLKQSWSPEQIAERLRLEYSEPSISHEAVYQFMYDKETKHKQNLVPLLARSHRNGCLVPIPTGIRNHIFPDGYL